MSAQVRCLHRNRQAGRKDFSPSISRRCTLGPVLGHHWYVLARPPSRSIPDAPGSYQFKDADGRVIYVGKARSLRQRLSSYFQDPERLAPRTAQMVSAAASVEWIEVRTEVDALVLEHHLIKQHRPRFNVRLMDDKSYPFLAVTVDDPWPRATVMRGRKRPGTRYFGPYVHVGAIRQTLGELVRSFPVRTCSDSKLARHERMGRPCLLFHIERCSGPCIRAVSEEIYSQYVKELIEFLEGDTKGVEAALQAEMRAASELLEFERAARLRDRLASVRKATEHLEMVTGKEEDFDVLGMCEDDLEASVQVFHVRNGRVVGRNGILLDKVEDVSGNTVVALALDKLYEDPLNGVPPEVLLPELPEDADLYSEWLGQLRGHRAVLRVPKRGPKKALQETVTHNASQELARHRLRRASDHNARARALRELQEYLGLAEAPLRIECYDMSHLQGSNYVGSMVVMEDGLLRPGEYRRFRIRDVLGNDDFAAMEEVLTRRLSYLAGDGDTKGQQMMKDLDSQASIGPEANARRAERFAYPPQLLLLDGGKGQLSVGVRVLQRLSLSGTVAVAALAKRVEEVFVPTSAEPVEIPRPSEALYLLQRARDEAHRYAISYHRVLRGKAMTKSRLDGIPGLGPTRQRRLRSELGGVRAVQSATLKELLSLGWLPEGVARQVYEHFHGTA